MSTEMVGLVQTILDGLNGLEYEVYPYPDLGMDEITEPGFYYNDRACQVEHWSLPCEYNRVMASHFSNKHGIIQDGFQSTLAFEDFHSLRNSIQNWNEHLKKYGVV